jgi:hypothetical protein
MRSSRICGLYMPLTSFHEPNRPDGMLFGDRITRRRAQEIAEQAQAGDGLRHLLP